jgi:hypothetical protein
VCVCVLAVRESWQSQTTTIYSSQHSGIPVWPADDVHTFEYEENKEQPKQLVSERFQAPLPVRVRTAKM